MANNRHLRTATYILNGMLPQWIEPGAIAVDATVGNGHDTKRLLELVGPTGTVYGFDIQSQAFEKTYELLGGKPDNLKLILESHEHLASYVPSEVDLILFNLGYLPGADKTVTTQCQTTLKALEAALGLLKSGGILAVVLYPGHEEGKRETESVLEWGASIPQSVADFLHIHFINQAKNPPEIVIIERK